MENTSVTKMTLKDIYSIKENSGSDQAFNILLLLGPDNVDFSYEEYEKLIKQLEKEN